MASGSTPPTRYSSTSVDVRRHAHGDQRGPLACLDAAVLVVEPQRASADERRTARGAHAPAHAARCDAPRPVPRTCSDRRRWPGCRSRTPPRRPRHRTTRAAAPRRRRRHCCADRRPASQPTAFTRARSSAVNCTPCTTSECSLRKPRPCEVFGRRHSRNLPVVGPDAEPLEHHPRRAGAVAKQLDFSRRLTRGARWSRA